MYDRTVPNTLPVLHTGRPISGATFTHIRHEDHN